MQNLRRNYSSGGNFILSSHVRVRIRMCYTKNARFSGLIILTARTAEESNCSSARTSTSEASERKSLNRENFPEKSFANTLQYASSRRWQFIAPAPVLMHQGSRSRSSKTAESVKKSKSGKQVKNGSDLRGGFGRRVLRSFVSACKECHAIKPPTREGLKPRNILQEHK
ncbi:Uncharacterized protein Adt_08615 [Abeliophyllum distichum]|uniref:Uncharacterized protein n=1 Tax=Abeliophyllum distichum TaxID=126358 RepID=A0ABD1UEU9_9LAMI